MKTIDDRYPDVFIERKLPDYYVVSDAGKTTSELFAQGIHLTDTRSDLLSAAAERLGVSFSDGVFETGCAKEDLYGAILAVSQCMNLGMWEVVNHKPDFGDAPVLTLAEHGLKAWSPPYQQRISKRVSVKGKRAKHSFEFVSFPDDQIVHRPIGLKLLRPSENSRAQAERYGFFIYDIEQTQFDDWLRLAVIIKADRWTEDSKQLIRKLSTRTLEVESGDEERIQELIPAYMNEVAA